MEVGEFRARAESDLDRLVQELQDETGRATPEEAWAWKGSLPRLADALDHEVLKPFHLHLGRRGSVSLEYQLPGSASWVDAVLLGRSRLAASAVLVELKEWEVRGDQPGPRAGLISHQGELVLHPSEQVKGYAEWCRHFHSAVETHNAEVRGCVFLTSCVAAPAYSLDPHAELTHEYPVFTTGQRDLADRFPAFLASHLHEPDERFANDFESGYYVQDRNLVVQVARMVADPTSTPFVLLDRQREGFEHCLKHIDAALAAGKPTKTVVIIEGPPGSGKSVLAAHLWARLVQEPRLDGPVVLTTTSSSQKNNWRALFQRATRSSSSRGVVMPANQFNPGITARWVKREREKGHQITVDSWRKNLSHYSESGKRNRSRDNSLAVSIVDEAHALIDPTIRGKAGVPTAGWVHHAGPQAWHIIRSSQVSIFLRDSEQSFRDNETTTRECLEDYAYEFGCPQPQIISLAGAQFRCGGSTEYMEWLDALLGLRESTDVGTIWRTTERGPFAFDVVSDPGALDECLREKYEGGSSARVLAPYARKWVTKKASRPHDLLPQERDFFITYRRSDEERIWARIWNYAPKEDYTLFVQAPEGSRMADDPLCEVGCPYVVRGFDYDYVGVLWLSDLVWRGRWVAQPSEIHETAWKNTRAAARKERVPGPATADLLRRLKRAYRILLSRAIRGIWIWFEDEETRAYVERQLGSTPPRIPDS